VPDADYLAGPGHAADCVKQCDAGAAYLLFLSWQAFRSKGLFDAPASEGTIRPSRLAIFRQGLITNLLNPKMVLFVLALFPQFVRPDTGSVVVQMLVLASVLNVVGLVVNGIVILAAGSLSAALRRQQRYRRLPQLMLGTVFAGLALRLAVDGRR
jgi:threonine/homoserine/homoserine lactone efflux protein